MKLFYRHAPPTKWIEAFVDTGAHSCMFHADFCHSLGVRLEDGVASNLGGVIGGTRAPIYYHPIGILVDSFQVQTMVGFSKALSVGGLLGRRGFFDSFVFTLDGTTDPPVFELVKLNRV